MWQTPLGGLPWLSSLGRRGSVDQCFWKLSRVWLPREGVLKGGGGLLVTSVQEARGCCPVRSPDTIQTLWTSQGHSSPHRNLEQGSRRAVE